MEQPSSDKDYFISRALHYRVVRNYIVNKCLVKSSGDKIKHCTSGILAHSSPIKHPGGSSSASPEIKSSNQAS